MPTSFRFQPIAPDDPAQVQLATSLWNAACGEELAVSAGFVTYNLQPGSGVHQTAVLGRFGDEPAGFVMASVKTDDPAVNPPDHGWIDALVVRPEQQRQGVGSRLLTWAEGWLMGQGCRAISVGGGLRPFFPGLPAELNSGGFFARHGYDAAGAPAGAVWDLGTDLALYSSPPGADQIDGTVRPAAPGDRDALLGFLQREFPGRWRYECEEDLAHGGRISDYMLLWTARGVDGCCVLTFGDSRRPMERFYPYRLPRPWGQLGSIGVSAGRRGRGYGRALVHAGLRRLRDNGVNGCIVDWTDLLDFYAKFGFAPYRSYLRLAKHF